MAQKAKRRAIFDAVRKMMGRGFRQAEVERLDDLIDALEGRTTPDAPSEAEEDHTPRRLSPDGRELIKRYEGCARRRADGLVEAYPDPGTGGEPWTIGWGSTGADRFNGGKIGPGTVWTQAQCDARAEEDYERYAAEVVAALGSAIEATSQGQFDALVSFHYNTGAIRRATLTRKHKAGDFDGAAREFKRWVFAGKRKLRGLVLRRREEEQIYRSGM